MKYIKAFFCTNLGIFLAVYLFGSLIIYFFGFLDVNSFFGSFYLTYLDFNLFFRLLARAVVGFISIVVLGLAWFLITDLIDHFIRQFISELKDIEKKNGK